MAHVIRFQKSAASNNSGDGDGEFGNGDAAQCLFFFCRRRRRRSLYQQTAEKERCAVLKGRKGNNVSEGQPSMG